MMKLTRIVLLCAAVVGISSVGALIIVSSSNHAAAGCPADNPNCGY
jgi:hypothetical protein